MNRRIAPFTLIIIGLSWSIGGNIKCLLSSNLMANLMHSCRNISAYAFSPLNRVSNVISQHLRPLHFLTHLES